MSVLNEIEQDLVDSIPKDAPIVERTLKAIIARLAARVEELTRERDKARGVLKRALVELLECVNCETGCDHDMQDLLWLEDDARNALDGEEAIRREAEGQR